MIFRQLFDRDSCTYTYLLGDPATGEALLIDPVLELVDRDLQIIEELGLKLAMTLDTHVHADHVTGARVLRERAGSAIVYPAGSGAHGPDREMGHKEVVQCGSIALEVRHTPGHTGSSVTYVLADQTMAFTGDTLMIRGCGRTDFQEGSAETLFASVHEQIFSLPDNCKLYPGHDYKGRTVSTVAEERTHNPRLGGTRTLAEFITIMDGLGLAYPAKIDIAVPANLSLSKRANPFTEMARTDGVVQVDPGWVRRNGGAVLLRDVRGPVEFRGEHGHVDGAKLVPLAILTGACQAWDREMPIVTISGTGERSSTAAAQLEGAGFQHVASMTGGMTAFNDTSNSQPTG